MAWPDLLHHGLSLNHTCGFVELPLQIIQRRKMAWHSVGLQGMQAPASNGLPFHYSLSQDRSKSYSWAEPEMQHLHGFTGANGLAGQGLEENKTG